MGSDYIRFGTKSLNFEINNVFLCKGVYIRFWQGAMEKMEEILTELRGTQEWDSLWMRREWYKRCVIFINDQPFILFYSSHLHHFVLQHTYSILIMTHMKSLCEKSTSLWCEQKKEKKISLNCQTKSLSVSVHSYSFLSQST